MKAYFHKVSQPFQNSFVVRHDVAPNFGKPVHYHTDLELHLTLKGEGVRFIGNKVSSFEPGDVLLLGEDLPHAWHAREKTDVGVEAIIIQFKRNCLGNDFFSLPEMVHIGQLYEIAKRGLLLQGGCRDKVAALMLKSVACAPFQRVVLLLEILDLIAGSKEYTTISTTEVAYKGDPEDACRLDRIYAYTLANFKKEISLAEIAAVSYLSVTSFCRYFKQRTNKRYSQFILEVRVSMACKFLAETDHSIAVVCYDSGFKNFSNFNRHFKAIAGKSPLEYRKSYKGMNL